MAVHFFGTDPAPLVAAMQTFSDHPDLVPVYEEVARAFVDMHVVSTLSLGGDVLRILSAAYQKLDTPLDLQLVIETNLVQFTRVIGEASLPYVPPVV
jgi:hypothetical protein